MGLYRLNDKGTFWEKEKCDRDILNFIIFLQLYLVIPCFPDFLPERPGFLEPFPGFPDMVPLDKM